MLLRLTSCYFIGRQIKSVLLGNYTNLVQIIHSSGVAGEQSVVPLIHVIPVIGMNIPTRPKFDVTNVRIVRYVEIIHP